MTQKLLYAPIAEKSKCYGCSLLTNRAVRIPYMGFEQVIPFCPKCRDTKSKIQLLLNRFYPSIPFDEFIIVGQTDYKGVIPKEDQMRPQKGVSITHLSPEEKEKALRYAIREPKIDGARALAYLTPTGLRLLSSRISKRTGEYSDRSENFPHISKTGYGSEIAGTVLDGEMYLPKRTFFVTKGIAKGTLNATVALMNASPQAAVELQRVNQCKAIFIVFDCLKDSGIDMRHNALRIRKNRARGIVAALGNPSIIFIDDMWRAIDEPPSECGGSLARTTEELFSTALEQGFEGLMLKDPYSTYYAPSVGARSKGWVKWKKTESHDGFITGYILGEAGNLGLVGALVVSQYLTEIQSIELEKKRVTGMRHLAHYSEIEIGAFSNVPQVERKEMSNPDGSLKKEYYGRVVEVSGQEVTKNGRLRHCCLVRWRPDKNKEECFYDIVEQEG